MSVVFMAFAIAVHATHKNWRDTVMRPQSEATFDKPLGLKFQLEDAKDERDRLREERDELDARLTAERNAAAQALIKLRNEYESLQDEFAKLDAQYKAVELARSQNQENLESAEARLTALLEEVEGTPDSPGLRSIMVEANRQREADRSEVIRLTDQKHQLVNELKRLRDYQQILQEDLDKARLVLELHDLQGEPELYAEQPPPVDGYVQATQGDRLVQISLGSDDGLLPNHKLEVYGTTGYVGRIEVVKTDFDRSVCQVVPETLQRRIQKDDLVTSRLLR
jgi:hypothetical protein